LTRAPAWAHPEGNVSGTRYVDARPLVRSPRVAWVVPVPMAMRPAHLLASPLGVVVGGEGGYAILDPRSGRVRLHTPRGEALALDGGRLVARERGVLVARELTSGKLTGDSPETSRHPPPLEPGVMARGPRFHVVSEETGHASTIFAVAPGERRLLGAGHGPCAIARDIVFFQSREELVAARGDGSVAWKLALSALRRSRVLALAPVAGRVHGLTTAARVFSLEEG
jgi:hypothetical protein